MATTFDIRLGREEDLAAIPVVEIAAAKLFPADRLPDPEETLSYQALVAALDNGLLWVAQSGTLTVGFAVATTIGDILHLEEIAVSPDFGRRGIGTALLQRVSDEAQKRKLASVTLTTFEDLPWNALFYEREGFQKLSPEKTGERLQYILDAEQRAGLIGRVAMVLPII